MDQIANRHIEIRCSAAPVGYLGEWIHSKDVLQQQSQYWSKDCCHFRRHTITHYIQITTAVSPAPTSDRKCIKCYIITLITISYKSCRRLNHTNKKTEQTTAQRTVESSTSSLTLVTGSIRLTPCLLIAISNVSGKDGSVVCCKKTQQLVCNSKQKQTHCMATIARWTAGKLIVTSRQISLIKQQAVIGNMLSEP